MAKEFYKNFINEKEKTLSWKNSNYIYISTILIIISVFVFNKIFYTQINQITLSNNFWNCFLTSINPNFSLIMFFVVSLYLERKYGSINYFILIICSIPIANIISFSFDFLNGDTLGWCGKGISCVSFFVFGLFLVDFLFNIKKFLKNKLSLILPIFIIVICIVFMCINLPDIEHSVIYFDFFGRLTENPGHYGPFATSIVIGFVFQFINARKSD